MFNILLTALLLLLPLMLLQMNTPYPGLHTGLWVSLFFWGRLYTGLSLLVFCVAAVYWFAGCKLATKMQASSISKGNISPAFILFLASMVIFCALGDVPPAYGAYLQLHQSFQDGAAVNGFFCSLAGPVLFGMLSDAKGPFPALMSLILTAASSLGIIACSSMWPVAFPVGCGFFWLSISGTFVLLPVFMRLCQGPSKWYDCAPQWILFLTLLWSYIYFAFDQDSTKIQHAPNFLTLAVYLVPSAAFLAFRTWKQRLCLVQ